jgi:pilus assembly protein CpaB
MLVTTYVFQLIRGFDTRLENAQRPQTTTEIVVAKNDLLPGLTIREEDLIKVRLPDTFIPDEVLRTEDEVIQRVARERILAGEFVRAERLADPESGMGLNAIIPRGMRAFGINISDGSAVSGFLNPGNYVDVIVTLTSTETPETQTLLQAIPILAVNDRLSNAPKKAAAGGGSARRRIKPSVTLALTPEQTVRVAHANDQGEIVLTLRNDIDVTHVTSHGEKAKTLIGKKPDPQPKSGAAPKPPVELKAIRGDKSQTMKLNSDGTQK